MNVELMKIVIKFKYKTIIFTEENLIKSFNI